MSHTMSVEDSIFLTAAAQDREDECVENSLADREKWDAAVRQLKIVLSEMQESRVNLCDAGCWIDLEGIVETFEPHSVERVTAAAREVAMWREMD